MAEWYYRVMGDDVGPVSPAVLRDLARTGEILPGTLVRKGAKGDWVLADKVGGLFGDVARSRTSADAPQHASRPRRPPRTRPGASASAGPPLQCSRCGASVESGDRTAGKPTMCQVCGTPLESRDEKPSEVPVPGGEGRTCLSCRKVAAKPGKRLCEGCGSLLNGLYLALAALASLIVIVAIGGFVFYWIPDQIQQSKLDSLKAHLNDYTSFPQLIEARGPYLKGKVVTIDRAKNDFDRLMLELPDDLCAKTPEEVGTVVWLSWGAKESGVRKVHIRTRTTVSQFHVPTCSLTIIDTSIPAIVGREHLVGGGSIEHRKSQLVEPGRDVYDNYIGPKNTDGVVNYLKSLPRK